MLNGSLFFAKNFAVETFSWLVILLFRGYFTSSDMCNQSPNAYTGMV